MTWALANPKFNNGQVLTGVLDGEPDLITTRTGQTILADKGYVAAWLDRYLTDRGLRLLHPSYRKRAPRPAQHLLKPLRQLIESVFDTLQGRMNLEHHGGRTPTGATVRVGQLLLALAAAI